MVKNLEYVVVLACIIVPKTSEEEFVMSEPHEAPLIIGESSQVQKVRMAIEKFAPLAAPVIIYGETGTGKELFARLLHSLSSRRNGPFIAVNAGAIPETLVESELFGYVGGAFTGALREGKMGLWEATNGGTLFLDEIGELSLAAQAKILRVLQERVIRPVGGTEDRPVDARIVAATNINLMEGVQTRTFRHDLYFRLHILHVTVPPLRDRQRDILPLIDYIMRKLCPELHLDEPPVVAQDAREKLLGYIWPGNIRELESIVTRTLSLCAGMTELHADDFELSESDVRVPPDILHLFIEKGPLRRMKTRAEDAIIQWALTASDDNQTAAARLLGVHRNTLVDRLRRKNRSSR